MVISNISFETSKKQLLICDNSWIGYWQNRIIVLSNYILINTTVKLLNNFACTILCKCNNKGRVSPLLEIHSLTWDIRLLWWLEASVVSTLERFVWAAGTKCSTRNDFWTTGWADRAWWATNVGGQQVEQVQKYKRKIFENCINPDSDERKCGFDKHFSSKPLW